MGLVLPPIVNLNTVQDLGLVSSVRQLGQDIVGGIVTGQKIGVQKRRQQIEEQELDIRKKQLEGSAIDRMLKISDERRRLAKDQFNQNIKEVEAIRDRLVSLPEKDAIIELKNLSKDPLKKKMLAQIGSTPEIILASIKEEKRPEALKELKLKADLAKTFDGADEFLKTGDINTLRIKDKKDRIDEKAALELSKSLRAAHRVKSNALQKELEFATPENRQALIDQINTINTKLIEDTRELFKTTMLQDPEVAKNDIEDKDAIMYQVLSTAYTFNSKEELLKDFDSRETRDALKELGINPLKMRPLMIEQFELSKEMQEKQKGRVQ